MKTFHTITLGAAFGVLTVSACGGSSTPPIATGGHGGGTAGGGMGGGGGAVVSRDAAADGATADAGSTCNASACLSGFCNGSTCGETGLWGLYLPHSPTFLAPGPSGGVWAASSQWISLVSAKGVAWSVTTTDWCGTYNGSEATIGGIAPTPSGGVAITGSVSSSCIGAADGGSLCPLASTCAVVAEYDASGQRTSWVTFAAPANNSVLAYSAAQGGVGLGVDATGNRVVLFSSNGSIDLGGGLAFAFDAGLAYGVAPITEELVLAKLDPKGVPIAAKGFTGATTQAMWTQSPMAHALALGADGSIVVVGSYGFGSIPGQLGGPALNPAAGNVFIAKFDANLGFKWETSILAAAASVQVDPQGNVLLLGTSQSVGGPFDAGPNSGQTFLTKLSPDGAPLWSVDVPLTSGGLAVQPDGNILISGDFQSQGNDAGAFPGAGSATILELSTDGKVRWARGFAGGTVGTVAVLSATEAAMAATNVYLGDNLFSQDLAVLRVP